MQNRVTCWGALELHRGVWVADGGSRGCYDVRKITYMGFVEVEISDLVWGEYGGGVMFWRIGP